MFGQNVTEHNPAPSPSGPPHLSAPIHQIFTSAKRPSVTSDGGDTDDAHTMAATAILDLNLHSVTMASKMQTTMERESEAGRAAREAGYEESEPEHELHGAAPNMLTAMFPSMDLEVLTTVLAWNGGDVVLAASSILDMWSDHHNSATTPDDGALARVLQRSLEVEVATGDQQLQNDEETARALQLAWDAEEQEEKKEQEEEQLARCSNGSRPPPPRAPQNSRAKMLAFLRARGTASTTRFTVRLLDGDDLPREITPLAGESALLAGYAPPPPATIASAEAAAVVALADAMAEDSRSLSAAVPEGRYDSRVQRAKRANLARKLSSDGKAPLLVLTKQGSSQSVCSLDVAGGAPAAE